MSYFEGRKLLSAGQYEQAEARFRETLRSDQSCAEPFLRLHECLQGSGRLDEAKQLFDQELPTALIQLPPATPTELNATFSDGFTFSASPFQHLDPRVKHDMTRWEIREDKGEYQHEMVNGYRQS